MRRRSFSASSAAFCRCRSSCSLSFCAATRAFSSSARRRRSSSSFGSGGGAAAAARPPAVRAAARAAGGGRAGQGPRHVRLQAHGPADPEPDGGRHLHVLPHADPALAAAAEHGRARESNRRRLAALPPDHAELLTALPGPAAAGRRGLDHLQHHRLADLHRHLPPLPVHACRQEDRGAAEGRAAAQDARKR